ncbi:MAG: outer membrane protein [Minisyncoccia bacterium]
MRKVVLLMAALALVSGTAQAADQDWSGLYAGVNGTEAIGRTMFVSQAGYAHAGATGWVLGAQLGYQWQLDQVALGVETDYDFTGIAGKRSELACPANVCGVNITEHDRFALNDFGTVRGRLGYAMGDFLPFVTGGYAYAGASAHASFSGAFPPVAKSISASGWVAGAGLDYRIDDDWALRVEYDHAKLANKTVGLGANIVRFGVNYFL